MSGPGAAPEGAALKSAGIRLAEGVLLALSVWAIQASPLPQGEGETASLLPSREKDRACLRLDRGMQGGLLTNAMPISRVNR
jgi:hypothetical protein